MTTKAGRKAAKKDATVRSKWQALTEARKAKRFVDVGGAPLESLRPPTAHAGYADEDLLLWVDEDTPEAAEADNNFLSNITDPGQCGGSAWLWPSNSAAQSRSLRSRWSAAGRPAGAPPSPR